MLVLALLAALLGAIIGSFLNVVAWRLPRGESLLRPGSHCPSCQAPVRAYDNVPVLAWVWLRGRCRACREPISPRYPLVEAATGALWATVVLVTYEDPARTALGLALVTLLVPVTLIDLDVRLIPNKLTAPAAVGALVLGAVLEPSFLPEQLIAGAGAFTFFLLAALARPGGMGLGDVKLAGVMGLYLGAAVAPALGVALVAGVAVGVVVIARQGATAGRRAQVPFGPFLALGGVVAVLIGPALVDAYVATF